MTEKTRTVVVIESHQQTIVRRSRRTFTTQPVTLPAERPAKKHRAWLGPWWKTVTLKSATVFALLKGLKHSGNGQPKNKS